MAAQNFGNDRDRCALKQRVVRHCHPASAQSVGRVPARVRVGSEELIIPLTIGEICSELATRNLPVSKRQDPVRAVSISLHVLVQEGCAMPAEQEGIRKWVRVRVANSNATTTTDHVVTVGEWDKALLQ